MQRFLTGLAVVTLLASIIVLVGVRPAESQDRPADRGMPRGGMMDHATSVMPMMDAPTQAICVLRPTRGSQVQGVLRLTQDGDAVRVKGTIRNLTPDAVHAIHVHEFGDTSSSDGSSAGSHYNPEGHDHALPDADHPRHAGDMGNLEADGEGVAEFDATFDNFTLAGMNNPVLGRAIVVHEKADDGGQPTGNAGGRLAYGVIGVAQAAPATQDKPTETAANPTPAPAAPPAPSN